MQSSLYTGWVRHRRFSPRHHEFNYRVFMVWLDLDEVDALFSRTSFWAMNKWAPVSFRREDFFGDYQKDLKQAVHDWIYQQTGRRLTGPVRMLANLRYFGYLINPIACYYCYSDDGSKLQYVVSEVTNTPWGEKCHYLLPCNTSGSDQENLDRKLFKGEFDKRMHVSPFHPMDMRYQWRLDQPAKHLNLHFDNTRNSEKVFDASLVLQREQLTASSMRSILWRFPFMTAKVLLAIYWQALKLWFKSVPLYANPEAINQSEVR